MNQRQRWLAGPNNFKSGGPWSWTICVVSFLALAIFGHWTWKNLLIGLVVGIIGALVLGVFIMALLSLIMRRSYPPTNACPVCGYDVRATLSRCPECGTELRWGQLP